MKPGDILTIRGRLPMCSASSGAGWRSCETALTEFANNFGIKIYYKSAGGEVVKILP